MTAEEQKAKWPDEIRLEMIERSIGYSSPLSYHYGYYDGYQKAQLKLSESKKQGEWISDEEIAAKLLQGMGGGELIHRDEAEKAHCQYYFSKGSKWMRDKLIPNPPKELKSIEMINNYAKLLKEDIECIDKFLDEYDI